MWVARNETSRQRFMRFRGMETLERRELLTATTVNFDMDAVRVVATEEDRAIVLAQEETYGPGQLYVTDGTQQGTIPLLDELQPAINFLAVVDDKALFEIENVNRPTMEPGVWVADLDGRAIELLVEGGNASYYQFGDDSYLVTTQENRVYDREHREYVDRHQSKLWHIDVATNTSQLLREIDGAHTWLGGTQTHLLWTVDTTLEPSNNQQVAVFSLNRSSMSVATLFEGDGQIKETCYFSPFHCSRNFGATTGSFYYSTGSGFVISDGTLGGTHQFTGFSATRVYTSDTHAFAAGSRNGERGVWRIDAVGNFEPLGVSRSMEALESVGEELVYESQWTMRPEPPDTSRPPGVRGVTLWCSNCGEYTVSQWFVTNGSNEPIEIGSPSRTGYDDSISLDVVGDRLFYQVNNGDFLEMWTSASDGGNATRLSADAVVGGSRKFDSAEQDQGYFYWQSFDTIPHGVLLGTPFGSASIPGSDEARGLWVARRDGTGSDLVFAEMTSAPAFFGTKVAYVDGRKLHISDFKTQNSNNRFDVNADGAVGPVDALLVVRELSLREMSTRDGLVMPERRMDRLFQDVDGDGYVGPVDALQVISNLPEAGTSAAAVQSQPAGYAVVDLEDERGDGEIEKAADLVFGAWETN